MMDLAEGVRAVATDPSEAISMLCTLAAFSPGLSFAADAIGLAQAKAQEAVAALGRRAALVSLARATSDNLREVYGPGESSVAVAARAERERAGQEADRAEGAAEQTDGNAQAVEQARAQVDADAQAVVAARADVQAKQSLVAQDRAATDADRAATGQDRADTIEQAALALGRASAAAGSAGAADTARQGAESAAATATARANEAGIAAAQAVGASQLYPSTTAGLAAVAENAYFSVPGSGNDFAILYRKLSGAAVEVARYPSKSALDTAVAAIATVPDDVAGRQKKLTFAPPFGGSDVIGPLSSNGVAVYGADAADEGRFIAIGIRATTAEGTPRCPDFLANGARHYWVTPDNRYGVGENGEHAPAWIRLSYTDLDAAGAPTTWTRVLYVRPATYPSTTGSAMLDPHLLSIKSPTGADWLLITCPSASGVRAAWGFVLRNPLTGGEGTWDVGPMCYLGVGFVGKPRFHGGEVRMTINQPVPTDRDPVSYEKSSYGRLVFDAAGTIIFQEIGIIPSMPNRTQNQYQETSILPFDHNSVLAIFRTLEIRQHYCVSRDGGRTWTQPLPVPGYPSVNSRTDLARSPSGRAVWAFNDSADRRERIALALSETDMDPASPWQLYALLDPRSSPAVSYTALDFGQDADGRYNGLIYCCWDRGRGKAQDGDGHWVNDLIIGRVSEASIVAGAPDTTLFAEGL
ncbi:exo-alpha-sialidase [Roseococcus sp.]|uniref:exo-alpha-sialidase n=1 Tax=Roseococcus sp. TaxID=2109646 RepID=UPI003BAB3353